ncbi:MAG: hypothetical protein ACTSRW_00750 [Candidatus Helarchaeota archaeon]
MEDREENSQVKKDDIEKDINDLDEDVDFSEVSVEIPDGKDAEKHTDSLAMFFFLVFGLVVSYLVLSSIYGFFPFTFEGQWIGSPPIFVGSGERILVFPQFFFFLYWVGVVFLVLGIIRYTKDFYVIGSFVGAGFIVFFMLIIIFFYLVNP